ncbi:MAG: hypothetical protein ABIH89_01490 [Elusimicrobiota bacterium]
MAWLTECTHCGKNFNRDMRSCPFCGVENKKPVSIIDPVCPSCGCALKNHAYRDEKLDICPGDVQGCGWTPLNSDTLLLNGIFTVMDQSQRNSQKNLLKMNLNTENVSGAAVL